MDILIIKKNKTLVNWESKPPMLKYKRSMEVITNKINSNFRLKKTFIFVTGSFLYFEKVLAATNKNPLAKIEVFGKTIFGMCLTIGYFLVLVMGIIDILKSLMQGDTKGIPKIVLNYALAYAALLLFPWLLDLIKEIFS